MTYQLHLGDCIEGMRGLSDKSVDHVIADPPYSEHVHSKQWQGSALTRKGAARCSTRFAEIGFSHLTADGRAALASSYARIAKRWVIVFCDLEGIAEWIAALRGAGLDYARACIWDKVDSSPQFTGDRPASAAECFVCAHRPGKKRWNAGGKRNVYRVPVNGNTGAKDHPTQKPLLLMRQILEDFTDPGELILDSHAGSGTTGAACLELGRRFIGWELDPKHYATASKRLAEASKQQPLFRVATTQEQERLPL
jgi:site-specific DNA-methyltransferase (adenine-specific)